MACTHDRIKSVNCRIFCVLCGAELPAEYLTGKNVQRRARTARKDAGNGKENHKKAG